VFRIFIYFTDDSRRSYQSGYQMTIQMSGIKLHFSGQVTMKFGLLVVRLCAFLVCFFKDKLILATADMLLMVC
jgi:hypothetical protein